MAKRKSSAAVGMELLNGDAFKKQLEKFAEEVQKTVVMEAVEAGTKPIERAMIPNTPESRGSRLQQSALVRQRWSGSKKLKTTIRSVIRTRRRFGIASGAIGLVGPSYSDGGGHGNLFSKDHKRKVLWGRDSGSVRIVNQFVKKTADESKAAAQAAMRRALKAGIDRAARKMASR